MTASGRVEPNSVNRRPTTPLAAINPDAPLSVCRAYRRCMIDPGGGTESPTTTTVGSDRRRARAVATAATWVWGASSIWTMSGRTSRSNRDKVRVFHRAGTLPGSEPRTCTGTMRSFPSSDDWVRNGSIRWAGCHS